MSPFDFYVQYEYAFAAVQLSLAMLGMGATLTPGDFAEVVRDPKGFAAGMVMQILGVPLLALLFISMLELDPGVAVGLALCASIPGGTVSNIFTFLGRGHVALSIALTAVTTLACLVTTPILLGWLIAEHMPPDFMMPAAKIAMEIGLYLMLPLGLGMLFLQLFSAHAERLSHYCIRGSLFVIVLIVIGAAGAGRLDMEAFGAANAVIILVFITVLAVVSAAVPRLLNLDWPDVTAINIEVTVRNTNLGLLIKASLFPAVVGVADPLGDNVLFTVLLFGGVMLLVGSGLVFFYRKQIPLPAS